MTRAILSWTAGAAGFAAGAVLLASSAVALTADPEAAAIDAAVRARLPALIAFVEQERGLAMKREVRVEVLSDDDFVEALFEDDGSYEEPETADVGATYDALGLVDDADDFYGELGDSYAGGVVGFYDGVTERLVVRGEGFGAYEELVLVHELTHALQDQWFEVDRPELDDDTGSEAASSFAALVEGDASRIERAWYQTLSPEAKAEIDEIEGGPRGEELVDPGVAEDEEAADEEAADEEAEFDVYAATTSYLYVAGLRLVDGLLAQGGQAALDAAFSRPPLTSEQVLHPEQVGTPAPASPALSGHAGDKLDQGVLGEVGLALLLGNDPLEPGGAQVGWEGDRYHTFDDDGELCTYADVLMADRAARDRLVVELQEAGTEAAPHDEAGLRLTSCSS